MALPEENGPLTDEQIEQLRRAAEDAGIVPAAAPEHTLNHNAEPADPARCAGCAWDAEHALSVVTLTGSDAAEPALAGEDAPAVPMTREHGIVYVQHLVATYLEGEIAGFKAIAANETAPEVDRKDAALCAELAEAVRKDLCLANAILMAQEQRVQLATAMPTVHVPGTKMPRGGA
jgi:hypothetical protein